MKISDLFKLMGCVLIWATWPVSAEEEAVTADTEEPEWLQVDEDEVQTRPGSGSQVGHEIKTGFSYSFGSEIKQGNRSLGDTDVYNSYIDYVATVPTTDSISTRLGFRYNRFDFGGTGGDPMPDELNGISLTLGADIELSDKWVMRVEFMPGIYSDMEDISLQDLNVPMVLGFSYIVDARLQWIFGMGVDFRNEYPVLPAVGVRWQFADDWTLNLIFPKPRLEYQIDPSLMVYVGGEVKGGTYAFGKNAGSRIGRPELDNEIIEYAEASVGGGVEYKFHPAAGVHLEGGAVIYRSLNFEEEDLRLHGSEPAPYVSIGLNVRF